MKTRFAVAALALLWASVPAGAAVRFVALGDAGKGNSAQFEVAKAIAAVCAAKGCDFALYLGDNFYVDGVSSVDDPQFQSKFEQPYAALELPFYAVLGNHDYGDPPLKRCKPLYEIAYSAHSAKWKMPHHYYTFAQENVGIFGIDTQGVMGGWSDAENRAWLENALAVSNAEWKIVIGHHPYLSNGRHGNAGNYEGCGEFCPDIVGGRTVKRLVESTVCGKADAYLSGHDHNLQWLAPQCGTEFIVSGAGAGTEGLRHRDHNETLWESEAAPGFLWVEIDGAQFTGAFYDQQGQLLYSRRFFKPRPVTYEDGSW